jgi:hypothetical protein
VKIGFAQALGLRGYFFWAISYDNEWKVTKQGIQSSLKLSLFYRVHLALRFRKRLWVRLSLQF